MGRRSVRPGGRDGPYQHGTPDMTHWARCGAFALFAKHVNGLVRGPVTKREP
jgi:hypothetical protein